MTTFKSASASQIATIKQLENNSKDLGKKINEPYVLLLTASIMPLLSNWLISKIDIRIFKFQNKLIAQLENDLQGGLTRVIRPFLPKLQECIGDLEELQPKISSMTQLHATTNILKILSDFIKFIRGQNSRNSLNEIIKKISEYRDTIKTSESSSHLNAITSQLTSELKEVKFRLQEIIKVTEKFPRILNNTLLIIPRFVSLAIGEKFLIAPLLNYLKPSGVNQSKKPKLSTNLELTTEDQAQRHITELNSYINQQAKSVKKNNQMTLFVTSMLFGYGLYNYWYGEGENSAWSAWLAANTTSSLINTGIKNLTEWYQSKQLNRSLSKKTDAIKNTLRELGSGDNSIVCHPGSSIPQSYIQIKLPNLMMNYSSNRWLRILSAIFQDYPITLLAKGTNSLYIRADFNLSDSQARQIKNKISEAKQRLLKLSRLQEQLNTLFKLATVNYHYHHDFDRDHLPMGSWQGYFSATFHQNISEIFANLFEGALQLQQDVLNPNQLYFSFSRFEPFDREAFESAKKQITQIRNKMTSEHLSHLSSHAEKSSRLQHRKPRAQAAEQTFDEVTRETIPLAHHQSIQWKSGTYHPNDSRCLITPITNKHAPANRQFLLFNLKAEDFGNNQELYNHFQEIAKNPVIVAAKGQQGLKYTYENIETEGKRFTARLKLKSTNTLFGGVRVYADEEKSTNGETLYICKHVALKHA